MAEKVQCPNCLVPAEKTGNKITCVACDSVFKITKQGGANLVEAGRVEKLEGRVGALESLLSPEVTDETAAELDAKAEDDAVYEAEADEQFLNE